MVGGWRHELVVAVHPQNGRCAKALFDIGIFSQLARAGCLPAFLPGGLIEGHRILHIASVAGEDQEVAIEHRRAGWANDMVQRVDAIPPQHSGGGCVDRRSAVGAKVHVQPAGFDGGRRRCVRILCVNLDRLVNVKHFHIVREVAGLPIHAHRTKRCAIGSGCGHPDLLPKDNRRTPACAGDRRFPHEVGRII